MPKGVASARGSWEGCNRGGRLWRPKGFDHFGDSDGSKTVTHKRYGDYEVRLIDFSQGRSTADCRKPVSSMIQASIGP
jgi:hypothetical protein